jgi:hypothetical protein
MVVGGKMVPFNGTFPCDKLPQQPAATNVRSLRPQDIEVVMAVGDSMTAGFAMLADRAYDIWELYHSLLEYRGDVGIIVRSFFL